MAEKSLRDGEHAHKEFPPPPYESIEHGKTAASLEVNEKSTGDRNKQSANKDKPSRGRLSRFTRWAFEPSAARQPAGNSSRADRRRAKDGVAVKPKAPVKSSVKPGFSAKAGKAANPPVVKPPAVSPSGQRRGRLTTNVDLALKVVVLSGTIVYLL